MSERLEWEVLGYRSPSSPTTNDDRLLELLEAAVNDKKSSMILIMGDFNYRNIDYVSHMVMSGDDSAESRFSSHLISFNLLR